MATGAQNPVIRVVQPLAAQTKNKYWIKRLEHAHVGAPITMMLGNPAFGKLSGRLESADKARHLLSESANASSTARP